MSEEDEVAVKAWMERKAEDRALSCSAPTTGSVSDRVAELESAIVNIFKWTGGKRVARECRRVLPDVCEMLDQQKNDPAHPRRNKTQH